MIDQTILQIPQDFLKRRCAPATAKTIAKDMAIKETRKPHDAAPVKENHYQVLLSCRTKPNTTLKPKCYNVGTAAIPIHFNTLIPFAKILSLKT